MEFQLNRRSFLKLALLTSGVAVGGYYGSEFLEMTRSSVRSIETQTTSLVSVNHDWEIPHLLRRAGFGASPGELNSYEKLGMKGALDYLVNYEKVDDDSLSIQPNITMAVTKPSRGEVGELIWWWVERMIKTRRPLEEKMTLFWHNHFATAIYKVRSPYLMFNQNQLLRSRALGNFEDLLMGITEDPAMLIWLDGYRNRKGAPNENYAREIMEIFATGRGYYTEEDVKEAARAFTGYALDKQGNVSFNPRLHDDGTKTFLGETGNFGPGDIVKILANHPATARNISRQLFQYFAYSNPSDPIVERLADTFTSSGGNIKAVVEAILKSDAFISQEAYMDQVKSPVEYVVTALRSLDVAVNRSAAIASLNRMGQLPFNPPTVFGWPSGITWINTSTIIERINFPLLIQSASGLSSTIRNGVSVDAVSEILFPEGLPREVIETIQRSTDTLTSPVDKVRNIVRLTMASPFYNLN